MDNSLKDRVLEATDIVLIVGEHVALQRKGREWVGLCPFHPDHRPSMFVSPQKQIFKCWSCGAGGDAIRFVELFQRVEFREALAALAQRAGIEVRRSTAADAQAGRQRQELHAALAWAQSHFRRNLTETPGGRAAFDYARRRGLTRETIEQHGLGFAADSWNDLLTAAGRARLRAEVLLQAGLVAKNDAGKVYDRFRNRLIFPIRDAAGRTVAFGGRALGEDPAKYLNSPESPVFSKSRVLYGLDVARRAIEERRAAIVVEGYLDAVLLHQHGFGNVVAALGTALTDAHAKLLQPRAETIYLCFDSDDAGLRAADRAVEVALRTRANVRVVVLTDGKDPADCVVAGGATAFEAHLKGACDALEFKWSQTLGAFGHASPQSRRAALEAYLRFIAAASLAGGIDPLEQNLLTGRLSDLLGVPAEEVFERLRDSRLAVRKEAARPAGEAAAASEYVSELSGLPAGLVTAVETVLGLLIASPACWPQVDDGLARATGYSQTWQRLYGVLLEVHDETGEYSIGQIVARCEDGALCELVSRARARVAGVACAAEDFAAARQHLAAELSVLGRDGLRAQVRASAADGAAYARLLAQDRDRDWILPAECRLRATNPSA